MSTQACLLYMIMTAGYTSYAIMSILGMNMQKRMCLLATGMVIAMLGAISGWRVNVQAQEDTPRLPGFDDPVMGEFDPANLADIDLMTLPLLPEFSKTALAIYEFGLAEGRDPLSFAKVGDCMTDNENFLRPLGVGEAVLGDYADLQRVIDHYLSAPIDPFSRLSQASAGGFNSASILDMMWANPEFCEAGESPLTCEFRGMNPSVALIMFGTNDVQYLTDSQFDYFLRGVVIESARQGTLPILSTFPYRPEFPEQSEVFNQIVVAIAQDYDLPLINLWRALDSLENHGIDEIETTHMSMPEDGLAVDFTGDHLEYGFPVRNLLTLQALDALLIATEPAE